jgi:uncharacterized membrane protein YcaP (DUF421 family)
MWTDLMHLGVSAPDKIVRTVAVYLVLAALIRLAGKRDLAALNAFDLVVMLLLSNVVQNAIIGPDNSLLGGALGAVVLVAVNAVVIRLISRNDAVAQVVEGRRTVLARHGHWRDEALRREGLRRADVDAAVRRQGGTAMRQVDEVAIEPGGTIVATLKDEFQPATKDDLARLEAKLDALLAR